MNNPVRYAIAAAAVLVVALVGYQLLPSNTGSGGRRRRSVAARQPHRGANASAPRPPAAGLRPDRAGHLSNGQRTDLPHHGPAWLGQRQGMSIRKNPEQPTEVDFDLFRADIDVFADACESEGTEERIGPTAEDLIAALVAQENSDFSDPVDVTVAGLPGSRLRCFGPRRPRRHAVLHREPADLGRCRAGATIWQAWGCPGAHDGRTSQTPPAAESSTTSVIGKARPRTSPSSMR